MAYSVNLNYLSDEKRKTKLSHARDHTEAAPGYHVDHEDRKNNKCRQRVRRNATGRDAAVEAVGGEHRPRAFRSHEEWTAAHRRRAVPGRGRCSHRNRARGMLRETPRTPRVERRASDRRRGKHGQVLRAPADFAVEQSPFGNHPHVIIAPPDHPLAGRRRVRRDELATEHFLVREEGSGTRALFESFFSGVEVPRPRIRIEIGSNETIKQAVMAGLGLALISAHTIEAEVTAGRLKILNVPGLPIVRQWYLVHRADKTLGPAAMAFWRYVER